MGNFAARAGAGFAAGGAVALARGGKVAVQQVATDAFGNAIGQGLVDLSQPQGNSADFNWDDADMHAGAHVAAARTQEWIAQSDTIQSKRFAEMDAYTPAIEYDYRNVMDIQSDQFIPVSLVNYRNGSDVASDQMRRRIDIAQAARERKLEQDRERMRFVELSGSAGVPPLAFLPIGQSQVSSTDGPRTSSLPGAYMTAYDPQAIRTTEAQRGALLNYLGGQSSMALGGVASSGMMIGTGDVVAASQATDALGPFDSLIAPMGGGAATRQGRVRGTRPIDYAKTYEADVRSIYGDVPFQQRTYEAFVDGNWVNGVADNVVVLNGRNTAIEAKYVDDWVTSLRNPASLEGNRPWAVAEQQKMIDQALKYSRAFDQAIYHTNSPELANHYGPLFRQAGVTNFEFVLTPSSR
jgi:hypothetical protein